MKYIYVILLPFLMSCTSQHKLIMQTWKITDVVFLDSLNTISTPQKTMMANELKKSIQFTFLADSAYQVKSGNDMINGRWWFSKDKKSLFTTTQEGTVESKIHELKKANFKFESMSELNQSFLFTCSPVSTDKK